MFPFVPVVIDTVVPLIAAVLLTVPVLLCRLIAVPLIAAASLRFPPVLSSVTAPLVVIAALAARSPADTTCNEVPLNPPRLNALVPVFDTYALPLVLKFKVNADVCTGFTDDPRSPLPLLKFTVGPLTVPAL